jgi:transcriptional antiterminator RfaH
MTVWNQDISVNHIAPSRDSLQVLTGRVDIDGFKFDVSQLSNENTESRGWYCARTKPKHEHIAAANLRKNLGLEVFHPRLRVERATRRGVVRSIEPLFPCYIFIKCVIQDSLNEIKYTTGINSFVRFGDRIPIVPDMVIEELQECFVAEEPMAVNDRLSPGDEVIIGEGAFAGMKGFVLRVLPARQRVQVLLDILGRHAPVEVDRHAVALEERLVADRVPLLAARGHRVSQI